MAVTITHSWPAQLYIKETSRGEVQIAYQREGHINGHPIRYLEKITISREKYQRLRFEKFPVVSHYEKTPVALAGRIIKTEGWQYIPLARRLIIRAMFQIFRRRIRENAEMRRKRQLIYNSNERINSNM